MRLAAARSARIALLAPQALRRMDAEKYLPVVKAARTNLRLCGARR